MLYIHIPFCKSRCIYCNFFSTTLLSKRHEYVEALLMQLTDRKYSTIYIGGGTPSMLELEDLRLLLEECGKRLKEGGEFTVECNPDDVTNELAEVLSGSGVNRVSLGIQTFSNDRLKLINRRHSAEKAREAVDILRAYYIYNVSVDLMFGFPGETLEDWKYDIEEAIKLNPNHISAYCLTIEEDTALDKLLSSGKLAAIPSEERLEEQYYTLCRMLKDHGYEHYEISNFCKPGHHSRHNSGYWEDKSYDALGAGAHGYVNDVSFDADLDADFDTDLDAGKKKRLRYWNVDDVEDYIQKANKGVSVVSETEEIDDITHYNDLITTAMRTSRGLSFEYVQKSCSNKLYKHFKDCAENLGKQGLVEITEEARDSGNLIKRVRLSPEKLFVSDDILSEFIYVE